MTDPMTELHPAARDGFAAGALNYAAGRPSYPPAITQWLTDALHLSRGKTVVDLGSGTGKFLPSLAPTSAEIIAIEPVAAMRQRLMDDHPDARVEAGSATAIPLPDACADAVVCAQAFHWFANSEALDEIHRVLKPGGFLGLVWNVRDDSVPWVAALADIMAPYETGVPRQASGAWRTVFPARGFGPLDERTLAHPGHSGWPEHVIVERILSVSFIAALPMREQTKVERQLHVLIAATPELSGKREVTLPYATIAVRIEKTGARG